MHEFMKNYEPAKKRRLKKETFSVIYKALRNAKRHDDLLDAYLGDAINTVKHYGTLRRLVKQICINKTNNNNRLKSQAFQILLKVVDTDNQRNRLIKSTLKNNTVSFRRRLLLDTMVDSSALEFWTDLIFQECLLDTCPIVSHIAIEEIGRHSQKKPRDAKLLPLLKQLVRKKIGYKGKLDSLCPFGGQHGLPTRRKKKQCLKYKGEKCPYEHFRYESIFGALKKGTRYEFKGKMPKPVTRKRIVSASKGDDFIGSINAAYCQIREGNNSAFPVLLKRVTQIAEVGICEIERKTQCCRYVEIPLTGSYKLRDARLIPPLKQIAPSLTSDFEIQALYELTSAGDEESFNKLIGYFKNGTDLFKRMEAAIWISEFIIAQDSGKDYHRMV